MPIDNVIPMHILSYSLIVIGHDAYVEHGTASQPHRSLHMQINLPNLS